jgi:hypothetical protein
MVMVETKSTPEDTFWCEGIAEKSLPEVEAELSRRQEHPESPFILVSDQVELIYPGPSRNASHGCLVSSKLW